MLWKILFVAFIACAAAAAFAATPAAAATSTYRLELEKPDAFRLAPSDAYVREPAQRADNEAPAPFADKPFNELIQKAAREAALEPALVHAVISVESGYNPAARSPKGAIGLMQVLPETASRYGVKNPGRSPDVNLRAGTLYLRDLLQLFDNRVDLALAAYNAGENAVLRYGSRIPPYRETQLYVPAVLAKYREWKEPQNDVVIQERTWINYMPGTRLESGNK